MTWSRFGTTNKIQIHTYNYGSFTSKLSWKLNYLINTKFYGHFIVEYKSNKGELGTLSIQILYSKPP